MVLAASLKLLFSVRPRKITAPMMTTAISATSSAAGTASFWMENTKLPLDMIFVQPDGAIKAIAADAVPMSEDVITVPGPVSAVIEVKAGTARRLGLKKGAHIIAASFYRGGEVVAADLTPLPEE